MAVQTTLLNTTGNDLSPEMKTYYEKRLLENAEPSLVYNQFADKYPIPKNGGKKIEFRRYTSLGKALTPLTEGTTPAGNKLNVETVDATVAQYGDFIELSDLLELTAIDNNVVQATKLLSSQAGRTLDTVTREVVCATTSTRFVPKTNSSGEKVEVTKVADVDATCIVDVDTIMQVSADLATQNADEIDGAYVAIVHPYVALDIMNDDKFVEVTKYGDPERTYKGEIGMLGGVRFIKSSEAKVEKNASNVNVFHTIVCGAHAYAVTEVEGGGLQHIVKQLGYGADPLNQRASCGWKATAVAKILNDQFMVDIISASSAGAKAKTN